jgi:hypothetical protein
MDQQVGWMLSFEDKASGPLEKTASSFEKAKNSLEDAATAAENSANTFEDISQRYKSLFSSIVDGAVDATKTAKLSFESLANQNVKLPKFDINSVLSKSTEIEPTLDTSSIERSMKKMTPTAPSKTDISSIEERQLDDLSVPIDENKMLNLWSRAKEQILTGTLPEEFWEDFWNQSTEDLDDFWSAISTEPPWAIKQFMDNLTNAVGDKSINETFWQGMVDKRATDKEFIEEFSKLIYNDTKLQSAWWDHLSDHRAVDKLFFAEMKTRLFKDKKLNKGFWGGIQKGIKGFQKILAKTTGIAMSQPGIFKRFKMNMKDALSSTFSQVTAALTFVSLLDRVFGPAIDQLLFMIQTVMYPFVELFLTLMDEARPVIEGLTASMQELALGMLDPLRDLISSMIPIVRSMGKAFMSIAPVVFQLVMVLTKLVGWLVQIPGIAEAIGYAITAYLVKAIVVWSYQMGVAAVQSMLSLITEGVAWIINLKAQIVAIYASVTAKRVDTVATTQNTVASQSWIVSKVTALGTMAKEGALWVARKLSLIADTAATTANTVAVGANTTGAVVAATATGATTIANYANAISTGFMTGGLIGASTAMFAGFIPALIGSTAGAWALATALWSSGIAPVLLLIAGAIVILIGVVWLLWEPIKEVFGFLIDTISDLWGKLKKAAKPIGGLILIMMGPVGWAIGAIILLVQHWDKFKKWIEKNAVGISVLITIAFGPIGLAISSLLLLWKYWDDIKKWFEDYGPVIAGFIMIAMGPVAWAVGAVWLLLDAFNALFVDVENGEEAFGFMDLIAIPFQIIGKEIEVVTWAIEGLFSMIVDGVKYIVKALTPAVNFLYDMFVSTFKAIGNAFNKFIDKFQDTIYALPWPVKKLLGIGKDPRKVKVVGEFDKADTRNKVTSGSNMIADWIYWIPWYVRKLMGFGNIPPRGSKDTKEAMGSMEDVTGGMSDESWNAAISTAEAMIGGMNSKAKDIGKAADRMAAEVGDRLPHSDAKTGPLSTITDTGFALVKTLATGIEKSQGVLIEGLGDFLSGVFGLKPMPKPNISMPDGVIDIMDIDIRGPIKGLTKMVDPIRIAIEAQTKELKSKLDELKETPGQDLDIRDLLKESGF